MTLRASDLQSDSDLDGIHNSCDVLYKAKCFNISPDNDIYWEINRKCTHYDQAMFDQCQVT